MVGDVNLIPSNIVNGVSIFGVTGTYSGDTLSIVGIDRTYTATRTSSDSSYAYYKFKISEAWPDSSNSVLVAAFLQFDGAGDEYLATYGYGVRSYWRNLDTGKSLTGGNVVKIQFEANSEYVVVGLAVDIVNDNWYNISSLTPKLQNSYICAFI